MKKIWISKDECQTLGGWSCYCAYWEIYNDNEEVVAYICEECGTIIMPQIGYPKGWHQFHRNNEPLEVELLEFDEESILIKVFDEESYTKRLYYKRKEDQHGY